MFYACVCVCVFVRVCQACGMYSHGEDKAGAAGQLYLVWQEEEAVQRQVFGKAQRRYATHTHTHKIILACTSAQTHRRHRSGHQSHQRRPSLTPTCMQELSNISL